MNQIWISMDFEVRVNTRRCLLKFHLIFNLWLSSECRTTANLHVYTNKVSMALKRIECCVMLVCTV